MVTGGWSACASSGLSSRMTAKRAAAARAPRPIATLRLPPICPPCRPCFRPKKSASDYGAAVRCMQAAKTACKALVTAETKPDRACVPTGSGGDPPGPARPSSVPPISERSVPEMTKASDLFIHCLEEEGVEYVFGVPGEENLDFLDSLSRSTTIRLILTRHEQGAGFMAATYGRHTGKTGVCVATLGPGATNFVTAAAYAQLGGMPILMITGQKPIKKSKQGRFQIIDVVEMMGPVTKFTHQLASADNIPSRLREAFRLAEEEKPGATHIEFPEDIAEEQTDSTPLKRSLVRRPLADGKAVRAAVERLEGARSPILVIGAGANR